MQEAAALPAPALEDLIRDARALEQTLEGMDLPDKKVYLFRLRKCRNFFQYLLDVKAPEVPPP